MKVKILLALILAGTVIRSVAVPKMALSSGNWSNNASWSDGELPGCGDSIVIPAGVTVTISTLVDHTACLSPIKLSVLGTLVFQTGKKLRLPCGSGVYVFAGGNIDPGGGGGSSNVIDVCNVTVWNAGMGPMTGPDCLPPGNDCNNFVLPVEFLSFQGELKAEGVLLNWTTASEKENDRFIIEKSTDGALFYEIGSVKGSGSTTSTREYNAWDKGPLARINYYRLRQVDYNGNFSFSRIIAVKSSAHSGFHIHPLPAKDEVFISDLSYSGSSYYIYDAAGRPALQGKVEISGRCYTGNLRAGHYSMLLSNGVEVKKASLIIAE